MATSGQNKITREWNLNLTFPYSFVIQHHMTMNGQECGISLNPWDWPPFSPQVTLSDLCTLWCHGEYCVRLLFELKGKWCFDNLYISNWKVEMNNSWLFETPHWFLTKGSLIGFCAFIFDSFISSLRNFSPCCYIQIKEQIEYFIYVHLPKWQIEAFLMFRLPCSHPCSGFWRLWKKA